MKLKFIIAGLLISGAAHPEFCADPSAEVMGIREKFNGQIVG